MFFEKHILKFDVEAISGLEINNHTLYYEALSREDLDLISENRTKEALDYCPPKVRFFTPTFLGAVHDEVFS